MIHEELKWILQYYLETTFFVPKIGFGEFEQAYGNYMTQSSNGYLENGYTDFLFCYRDSGDFTVIFDPKKYDAEYVLQTIENIMK